MRRRGRMSLPNTWKNYSQVVADSCYPESIEDVRTLLAEALQRNIDIRARGSLWSFSKVAATDGISLTLGKYSRVLPKPAETVDAPRTRRMRRVAAGAKVSTVHYRLARQGRQLPVSGASSGQSWIAAIATGSHGAAIGEPPLSDYVRALDVMVAPDVRLWIEPAQAPHVVETPSGGRLAEGHFVLKNDQAFRAAVVGLGCCGIIVSGVVDTIRRRAYRRVCTPTSRARLEPAIRSAATFQWRRPAVGSSPSRPYHVEMVFNPNNDEAFEITLWEDGAVPAQENLNAMGSSAPAWVAGVAALIGQKKPGLAMDVFAGALRSNYPREDGRTPKTFRKLFPRGALPPGSAPLGFEIAVARTNGLKAYRICRAAMRRERVAGPLALRYCKGSKAYLASTRFPNNVTLEIGSTDTQRARRAFASILTALRDGNIPYGIHPGMWTDWEQGSPGRNLKSALGTGALRSWKRGRAKIFERAPRAAALFSTPFSEKIGLT